MPTQICVFNPTTNLIDVTNGVAAFSGASAAGAPVVLNAQGALDTSFFNSSPLSATAAVGLAAGSLVNLFYGTVGGVTGIYAQLASALSTNALPAMGYVTATYVAGDPCTVLTSGLVNVPITSGFSTSNVGQAVYLSTTAPGSVTLTQPSSPDLIQPLGFVYSVQLVTSPNYVQFPFQSFPLAQANQVPPATTSSLGLVKPDGVTIDVTGGVISVPAATGSAFGLVKPDDSTITVSGGVLSVSSTVVTGGGDFGFIPLFSGSGSPPLSPPTPSHTVTVSHLDDGVTEEGTITSSEPVVVQGSLTASYVLPYTLYSVALGNPLPTPNQSLQGAQAVVSDATSPTYMAPYVSGGTVTCAVICSYVAGSPPTYAWLTH